MKMISICNKKGGVGKTTLCKNIAYKLGLENKKVLLIDLDPQATITMQVNNDVKNDKCILDIIASKSAVKLIKIINLIERTKYKNIDIIMANNEFNSFYDNASKPLPFLDFNQLAHDLTNTRLGTQNSNVDWKKLYKDVGLSQLATETAKKEQLRFYNIMAGVYGKDNILRLMQSVTQAPISNKNVVAYNQYSYLINSQRQIYGPDFVNTKEINANYQAGWWATNNIISVSTHEYGHAFDNFLSLTNDERSTFNNNWNWPKNNKIENYLLNKNIFKINNDYSSVWRAQNHVMRAPISDCSQLLMDYLNDKVNISNSDYQKRLVFPMIIVQSNYGRIFWSQAKPYKKGEFFAEAFAEWLLTPQSGRGWNWELLNDFFIKKLPTYL